MTQKTCRLFLLAWVVVDDPDLGTLVTNAVEQAMRTAPFELGRMTANYYPEGGADGIPITPYCMVLVQSSDQSYWSGLDGVVELEHHNLNDLLSGIDTTAQNAALADFGIDASVFANCVTWGDYALTTVQQVKPEVTGFYNVDPAEFA